MLQKASGRGPCGAMLHTVDGTEAPRDAPLLPLDEVPDHPVLRGFDRTDGG
ncbi:hypothetical protein ACF081_17525 [Streptomyces longwoodensis]|uniref:hypothetical protein n=1 Tax=Streptomyces longwoodensis TaxID=68231 RepID=UPI003700C19A